jgi:SHS2 domain-containing protein
MQYKILEHPADVRVQVFGKTKEELFLNAMKGMNEVLRAQVTDNSKQVAGKIRIKSVDLNALLVDFLSEVLYLIQTKKEIYNSIKFSKFNDKELEGELIGNKVESFGEDIKAVTYHGLKITKNKQNLWQATILFDI